MAARCCAPTAWRAPITRKRSNSSRIKVADGPLTSKLQKIREGDTILVGRKATGTLITDNLIPGKRLLLLSTGTGLAPFASLIKDPDVYERFESIVLVHGCRQVSELAYGEELVAQAARRRIVRAAADGEAAVLSDRDPRAVPQPRPHHRPDHVGTAVRRYRIRPPLDIETDRIMMCGSPGMLEELRQMFEARGFLEGSHNEPGHFVIEKAFVER